jgi:hypothetical protein
MYADEATAIGFTVGRQRSLFPCSSADWLINRPQTVRIRTGSVFLEANSPTKFLPFNHCSHLSARATTYLGFCPLLDITVPCPPFAGTPTSPLCSVLRRSQPLDGLLHSTACGLISSHNRVQDSIPSRGLSTSCRCSPSSEEQCPLVVGNWSAHLRTDGHKPIPRLRGFAPHKAVYPRFGS